MTAVRARRLLLWLAGLLVLLWLTLPTLIIIPVSFTDKASFLFPPKGWSLRWYRNLFEDPAWRDAALNSVLIAALSALIDRRGFGHSGRCRPLSMGQASWEGAHPSSLAYAPHYSGDRTRYRNICGVFASRSRRDAAWLSFSPLRFGDTYGGNYGPRESRQFGRESRTGGS